LRRAELEHRFVGLFFLVGLVAGFFRSLSDLSMLDLVDLPVWGSSGVNHSSGADFKRLYL